MKQLNTKVGVFLTTYTQAELDEKKQQDDLRECALFLKDVRSFNPESPCYISLEEAKELTGLEVKEGKNNPQDLYTNYKGNPFDIPINEAELFYIDPIDSLKSAFEAAAPEFDFEKDYFYINIVE